MPINGPPNPASPRGFTPVPNCYLVGPIPQRLTAQELRTFLWVLRQALGWRRGSVRVAPPELCAELHIPRERVYVILHRLESEGLIQARMLREHHIEVTLVLQESVAPVMPALQTSTLDKEVIERRGNAPQEHAPVIPALQAETWDKPLTQTVVGAGLKTLKSFLAVSRTAARTDLTAQARFYLSALTRCGVGEGRFLKICERAACRLKFFPTAAELIELSSEVHKPIATSPKPKQTKRPEQGPEPEPTREEVASAIADLRARLGLEGEDHADTVKPHRRP